MPRNRREMIHFYELQLFLLIPTFERNQSPRILYNVADWQPVRRFERARALTLYAAPWLPYFLLLLFLLLLLLLFFYRSEEHTSELQSLMRISYAVFCLK